MTATATPGSATATPGLPPHDKGNIVEVNDLKVHFPIRAGIFKTVKGSVKAVDGVTVEVRRGETLGLVGESGCGKSTIGRAMIRLRDATSGTVRFDGVDLFSLKTDELRKYRRRMQIIFQDPYGSLDPRMTVSSIVSEPIETHHLAEGSAKDDRVAELLKLVGLDPKYVKRYPHEFSGGQRQRIGVARALAVEPEFIVCDEPISALDVSIQAQVLNLLIDLGKIVEIGPPETLYAAPGHPYTRALLSAVPVPDPVAERMRKRVILKGDVPSPVNPPPGCRFHTRCWLYERLGQPEDCRTIDPELKMVATTADHQAACHHADEALKTDVGVAHIGATALIRRGTPASALASLEAEGKLDAPEGLATPAFLDDEGAPGATRAADGFGTESPDKTDTPTDMQSPF
jgi:oligopeptide transport system ATP-binding protein